MGWEEHDRHRRSRPPRDGLARMAQSLGIKADVARVRRIGGGIGSATHAIWFAGGPTVVIKRYPSDREYVESEWNRLCFAYDAGLRVPAPLGVDIDGDWFAGPTLVMARIPGRPDLAPSNPTRYAAEVVAVLKQIHDVDVAAGASTVLGRHPIDTLEPPAEVPAGALDPSLAARALKALIARFPWTDGQPTVFNHGDFHPGNLMWSRGRLTGVIDWSAARIGYPAGDIAAFVNEAELLLGPAIADAIVRGYEAEVGPLADRSAWRLLCAFSTHHWAHQLIVPWHEQGRLDLTLEIVTQRLTDMTLRLLDELDVEE